MKFDELPAGESIFIDANIFVYHFTGVSEECTRFLSRCEEGAMAGYTTSQVVLEVMHRLMMLEAVHKGLVSPGNVAKRLKDHPEIVKSLSVYADNTLKIGAMGVSVVSLSSDHCSSARRFQQQYGLLTNDAALLAACQDAGCSNLATRDEDFLRVKGIRVYLPSDV
ncbi:hypothetical protein SY88_04265 [Clostridiales bacterium PH28_bin88]|nr:hypothetical protein SY88_04265 [Clostridiales bacterium PH28_bin88]